MAQKSIFIGSANESWPLAAKIGQGLAEAGYRPLRHVARLNFQAPRRGHSLRRIGLGPFRVIRKEGG